MRWRVCTVVQPRSKEFRGVFRDCGPVAQSFVEVVTENGPVIFQDTLQLCTSLLIKSRG